jgi:hypothetical protein
MLDTMNLGSDFLIWLGSIAGGLGVLSIFVRQVFGLIDIDDQNALIGQWFGYGYFHAGDIEQFYREEIKVWRSLIKPWQLSMHAIPISTGKPTAYTGWIRRVGFYMYSYTKEGIRNDPCFEIGKILLGEDHLKEKIVGLHLGGTYQSDVHVATGFVWSRKKLDEDQAQHSRYPSEKEKHIFEDLCSKYLVMNPESHEFLLRYNSSL